MSDVALQRHHDELSLAESAESVKDPSDNSNNTQNNGIAMELAEVNDISSPEEIIQAPLSNAIPREILAGNEAPEDIPVFHPEDSESKIGPARPDSVFVQLSDPVVAAHELFEAIRGGATGLGTNESRILHALAHKDLVDFNEVEKAYREHYNRDLKEDLKADLKGMPRVLKGVETVLAGVHPSSTAALLNLALILPSDHRDLINDVLGRLTPDEMIELREAFRAEYNADIRYVLASKLTGDDLRLTIAILEQNHIQAYAVRLHEVLSSAASDSTALAKLLIGIPTAEFSAVSRAFERTYAASLFEVGSKLLSERQLEALRYVSIGELDSAQAVLLKDAISGSGDIRILAEILLGASNELRDAMLTKYNEIYKQSFERSLELTNDIPHGSRILAERILKHGSIDLAGYLYRELTEPRLAPERLVTFFVSLPLERCSIVLYECKDIYGLDALPVITQRLSGYQRFDVRMAMLGKPDTIDDIVDGINAHHEFDRGGIYGLCSRLLDAISPHGRTYDLNVAALNQLFHQRSKLDRLFSDDDEGLIFRAAQFCDGDRLTYRDAKLKLSGFIARSCGFLTAIISFSLANLLLFGTDFGMAAAVIFGAAFGLFVHAAVSLTMHGSSREGRSIIDGIRRRKAPRRGRKIKGYRKSGTLLIPRQRAL